MSHTLGPWEIKNNNIIVSATAKTTFGKERPIANIFIGLMDCESEANARLIAAAPELLEACKEAHKHHISANKDGNILKDGVAILLGQAIAKAEGGKKSKIQ